MNPMLMFLLMQNGAGPTRRPSTAALMAMGLMYAAAWSIMLLFLFDLKGLLIGWPVTIVVCGVVGFCMERFKMDMGDLAGIMIHVVLAGAVIIAGLSLIY